MIVKIKTTRGKYAFSQKTIKGFPFVQFRHFCNQLLVFDHRRRDGAIFSVNFSGMYPLSVYILLYIIVKRRRFLLLIWLIRVPIQKMIQFDATLCVLLLLFNYY